MAYIGQFPSAVITTTAQIQDCAVELVDISAAAQASLGTVDFYGFKTLDNNNSTLKIPPEGYILPIPKPKNE